MAIRRGLMAQMASGHVRMASGEFDVSTSTSSFSITHNLNSTKLLVIAQRINKDHSVINQTNTQYRDIVFIGISKELSNLDTDQPYTYNNGTNQYIVATGTSNSYPVALTANFGSSTATIVNPNYDGNPSHGVNPLSQNEATCTSKYNLCNGHWVWRAYALD